MDRTESGQDSEGRAYTNIVAMWQSELASETKRAQWYREGNRYWTEQAATISGVLGGLEQVHEADINTSRAFLLQNMQRLEVGNARAVDCGAGIGRITKHLLLPHFDSVDLVEQCEKYIEAAKVYVSDPKAGAYFPLGLQDFTPETGAYDVIWIQWVLPYLTDDDLVAFLRRAMAGLKRPGLIFVKENVREKGFILHRDDYSVTRSEKLYDRLFGKAQLRLVAKATQMGFPEDLYPVKLWALAVCADFTAYLSEGW